MNDCRYVLCPRSHAPFRRFPPQFLLGREVIASRLRITGDQEPKYGLPESMLPELHQGPGPSTPRTRALTDRLLSRLGAASLVWHLVIPGRLAAGAAPPADPPPAGPDLPYKPVNIFDMVLDALSCVVDPDTAVEHLPRGSQLTLVEPAMLLVRLTLRMRRAHLKHRLVRLWEVLCTLMRRPDAQLQYSEHRPLQLIGRLLRLDQEQGLCQDRDQRDVAPAPGGRASLPYSCCTAPHNVVLSLRPCA
jgi:hypothetical protein